MFSLRGGSSVRIEECSVGFLIVRGARTFALRCRAGWIVDNYDGQPPRSVRSVSDIFITHRYDDVRLCTDCCKWLLWSMHACWGINT